MFDLSTAGWPVNLAIFLFAAGAILLAGAGLAAYADRLADRLRWGKPLRVRFSSD